MRASFKPPPPWSKPSTQNLDTLSVPETCIMPKIHLPDPLLGTACNRGEGLLTTTKPNEVTCRDCQSGRIDNPGGAVEKRRRAGLSAEERAREDAVRSAERAAEYDRNAARRAAGDDRMMAAMIATGVFGSRRRKKLAERLMLAAKLEGRTVADTLAELVTEYLRRKGL